METTVEINTIVIKVKYQDTLRRFNARVTDDGLALNMEGLRGKIFSLFKFAPDAVLKLTYLDEDGDEISLVEDEDLNDAVKQSLNPLRIMVSLNTEESCKLSARSSGSSTPLRSPGVQHPLQNLNSNVSEILKSLPEPLRQSLSKLSSDLASKATTSAPNLAEIVDTFSKLGLSYLNQLSEIQAGSVSSNQDEAPKDPEGSNVKVAPVEVSQNARAGEPSSNINKVIPVKFSSKSEEVNPKRVNGGVEIAAALSPVSDAAQVAPSGSTVANVNRSIGSSQRPTDSKPSSLKDVVGKWKEIKKHNLNALSSSLKYWSPPVAGGFGDVHRDAASSWGPNIPQSSDLNGGIKSKSPVASGPSEVHRDAASSSPGVIARGPQGKNLNGNSSSKSPVSSVPNEVHRDSGSSSSGFINWGPDSPRAVDLNGGIRSVENSGVPPFFPTHMNECPFTGMPMPIGNGTGFPLNASREVPYKRSYSHNDAIFHRGVRCDGCGVHPITGPRFKSKVKENYDLCSICFAEMGNEAEYLRIDRPVAYHHTSFRGLYDHMQHARLRPPVFRGFGVKPHRPKLDGRFIQDVNILDGTIMAPSTTFTKIWRMRNNGTVAWPEGSQLVWIGGDKLTDVLSVGLEIAAGLPMDQEIDVAVDFVAPELPGRYISYWRMATPTGQKFGQRVWVLIQVDASMKEPVPEMVHGFNLNWPPASDNVTAPLAESSNLEPVVPEPNSSNVLAEPVVPEPVVYANVKKEHEHEHEQNFPINDSLLVGGGANNSSPSKPSSSSISYPIIIDLTEDEEDTPIAPTSVPAVPTVEGASGEEDVTENNTMEETLLKELKDMGFNEVNLNKKILRKNAYDLEQSVDDLCGITEWDPILEELQEMGFHDKETNKKLLKKNNGSIKRVVMDLIAGETI